MEEVLYPLICKLDVHPFCNLFPQSLIKIDLIFKLENSRLMMSSIYCFKHRHYFTI